jgi:hypothetical protein
VSYPGVGEVGLFPAKRAGGGVVADYIYRETAARAIKHCTKILG